ncbi:MAG TPA: KGG domain-containing protein [Oxalicibacterium sp.]
MANNPGKSQNTNRGFANMDAGKQREIAAQGGRAAHASGNAHEFNSAEASAAGRKGGAASHRNKAQASSSSGTRGGSSAQHAHAGQQSHKNK